MPADDCSTGDVRLVGGEHEAEGRVELCISGRWETLCDNEWTDNHTAVVCRHLGFSDIIGGVYTIHEQSIRNGPAKYITFLSQLLKLDSAYYTSERFGSGTGPIFIDYINCTGK